MKLPDTLSKSFQKSNRSHFGLRAGFAVSSLPIFATMISLSLFGFVQKGEAVTSSAAKHRVASGKTKPKAVIPGSQPTAVKPVTPQAVLPPPNRIHNMMLPVPTITERLIRDIMVGKPQEAAPPAGTEAFSNEGMPASTSGQPAPDGSSQVPPASTATDTANAPAAPGADATSPKSNADAASAPGGADAVATPVGTDTAATPAGTGTAMTPAGTDTAATPAGTDTAATPAGTDTAATPAATNASAAPASNDTTASPAANGAAANPTIDAPSGMAPDAVVAPKPEIRPDEGEKPQEKSELPEAAESSGRNLCEAPSLHERLSIEDGSTISGVSSTAPVTSAPTLSPQAVSPRAATEESTLDSAETTAQGMTQDTVQHGTEGSTQPSTQAAAQDSAQAAAQPSAQSSAQAAAQPSAQPSAQAAAQLTAPVSVAASAETTASTEQPRERISIDGLEGATYAVKTNGGFGSAMVSRQSMPIGETARTVTTNVSPQNMGEGEEIDLDSASTQAGLSTAEPGATSPSAPLYTGKETVVDTAATTSPSAQVMSEQNMQGELPMLEQDLDSATTSQ